MKDNHNIEM